MGKSIVNRSFSVATSARVKSYQLVKVVSGGRACGKSLILASTQLLVIEWSYCFGAVRLEKVVSEFTRGYELWGWRNRTGRRSELHRLSDGVDLTALMPWFQAILMDDVGLVDQVGPIFFQQKSWDSCGFLTINHTIPQSSPLTSHGAISICLPFPVMGALDDRVFVTTWMGQ